jgi:hypothetical protein
MVRPTHHERLQTLRAPFKPFKPFNRYAPFKSFEEIKI